MELISSDAYLKGGGNTNSALLDLKKNLREELSSINMAKDDEDDDFDKYCQ